MSRPVPAEHRQAFRAAVRAAATAFGVAPAAIAQPRGHVARRARRLAAYLTMTAADVPLSCAARLAGCGRGTLYQAVAQIEDRRDDPVFDAFVTSLEERIAC
jgi:hypothetical protein